MNTLDVIIALILFLGLIQGYRKGMIMEIISILAFVLGIFGALKLMNEGIVILEATFGDLGIGVPIISFIVIFLVIIIVLNILGKVIRGAVHMTPLGFFDNMLGALIGIFKWALGLSIFFWIVNLSDKDIMTKYSENAKLYPKIEWIAPSAAHVTQKYVPFISDFIDNFKKSA